MNKKLRKRPSRQIPLAAALLLLTYILHAQQPAGTSPAGSAQPAVHEFSLGQAIDYAAKNSAKVKNALLDYQIQEQSNRATTSQALPQVSGNAGFTDYLQIPISVAPGKYFGYPNVKLVGIPFATKYSANYGVTLKQVLFDGQVFVGLKARQTALDYYKANQELTEQQLRQNITKVYYQLLLSKVQVELIDANIARAQELLHNSSEMFKNGFAERLDVDKATVQLTNLQSNRVQVLYNIDDGYLGLKVLMGMPVRDSLVLTDSLTYEMVRQGSLSDAYKYSDRRDFQALEFNRKLNEFDIQRYKRQYLPTASLTANYAQTGYGLDFSDITGGKFWFPSSYVGLNISVPIFDGFYKDANVRQARLKLQQTNNNLEAMQISIDNDVKNAQLKFGAALADLDFQKKNMDLATGVYEQTRKKFDQGLGSNTEITSAQTDMIQAQNNYFNALYNAISAKVDYQFAIGKL
ncbi:MAG TPA: TolC family protein [Puia sp.]|jgi:outer membrane protein TolC|nr:TolC family protein [Puia sp.]